MTWAPRMDVYEKDNTLIVKADLPGFKNEDVQVELDDDGLVIRGASKAESEVKEENYYRMMAARHSRRRVAVRRADPAGLASFATLLTRCRRTT